MSIIFQVFPGLVGTRPSSILAAFHCQPLENVPKCFHRMLPSLCLCPCRLIWSPCFPTTVPPTHSDCVAVEQNLNAFARRLRCHSPFLPCPLSNKIYEFSTCNSSTESVCLSVRLLLLVYCRVGETTRTKFFLFLLDHEPHWLEVCRCRYSNWVPSICQLVSLSIHLYIYVYVASGC